MLQTSKSIDRDYPGHPRVVARSELVRIFRAKAGAQMRFSTIRIVSILFQMHKKKIYRAPPVSQDTQIPPGRFLALPRTKLRVGRMYIQFLHYLEMVSRDCGRFSRQRDSRGVFRYQHLYMLAWWEDHAGTSDIRGCILYLSHSWTVCTLYITPRDSHLPRSHWLVVAFEVRTLQPWKRPDHGPRQVPRPFRRREKRPQPLEATSK